jgi:hypothetical protein
MTITFILFLSKYNGALPIIAYATAQDSILKAQTPSNIHGARRFMDGGILPD